MGDKLASKVGTLLLEELDTLAVVGFELALAGGLEDSRGKIRIAEEVQLPSLEWRLSVGLRRAAPHSVLLTLVE